ncbi:MAG: hypothetical protein HY924_16355 [Elusimicrobia bacterium]|nr:hypothetical protein [Elusimicrobiota bacterium]
MRLVAAALIVSFLAAPVRAAGPLDLDLYAGARPVWPPPRSGYRMPVELWRPGSPLALRGEPTWVVGVSHAGNAALGAVALAESIDAIGRDPGAARNAVGFGIITAVQVWSGWLFLRDVRKADKKKPR